MFIARLGGEGGKIFVEHNVESVVNNLQAIEDGEEIELEYWTVKDGPNVSLKLVTLKKGPRPTAVLREVVVIEAGGVEVGSIEVKTL